MPASLLHDLARVAQSAGTIALEERQRGLRRRIKPGNELVTSAEALVHEYLSREIPRLLPGVGVLTEESPEHRIPDGRFVVIDEIDGTAPYAAGADTWGVMIAVIDESPTCGVICLPQRNVTITAERKRGCSINGSQVKMTFEGTLGDCVAGADLNAGLGEEDWLLIRRLAAKVRTIRCLGCAAASAFECLEGITQIYLNPRGGKIWDFAAVSLAIVEAGGVAVSPHGAALRWDRLEMEILACADARLAGEFLASQEGRAGVSSARGLGRTSPTDRER